MTTDRSVPNTPAPYQDDDEIDLTDLLFALWKQKWIIILCAALFVAGGIAVALMLPKTYEAQATLLILPPISREMTEDKNTSGQMFSSEIYKDLAVAQDLLNDVIKEVYTGTEIPSAAAVAKGLSVGVNKASEKDTTGKLPFTLSVSLKGGEPQTLTSFLTSWITHFTRRNAQLFSTRGTQSFEYISENFEIVKKDLKAAEDELADYRKQYPIDFLEGTLTTLKTLNRNYQEDISLKKRTLVAREAELLALKKLIKEEPEKIILNRSPSNEMLLNVPLDTDTPKNENMVFRDEIINERHSLLRNMITLAETEVQSLKASITDLDRHLQATEKEYNEKQVLLVESKKNIQRLEREEKALNDAYTNLAKKFQETRIAAAEAADPIRVIEQPVLPTAPVAPRKTLIVALSGVLGVFIGLFAALIVNMIQNRREASA